MPHNSSKNLLKDKLNILDRVHKNKLRKGGSHEKNAVFVEELFVQLGLVLAQMDHERAAASNQRARVTLMLADHVVYGVCDRCRNEQIALLNVTPMTLGQGELVVRLIVELHSLFQLFHERLDASRVDAKLRIEHRVCILLAEHLDRLVRIFLNRLQYRVGYRVQRVDCVVLDDLQRFA
jgi:hypothetical protein